jgi:hypothetical protein
VNQKMIASGVVNVYNGKKKDSFNLKIWYFIKKWSSTVYYSMYIYSHVLGVDQKRKTNNQSHGFSWVLRVSQSSQ